eukprot:g7312.t1
MKLILTLTTLILFVCLARQTDAFAAFKVHAKAPTSTFAHHVPSYDSKFVLPSFQLKLENIFKTAKNEHKKHKRSLFSTVHMNSFRRLNEPLWMCHGPLAQDILGQPAPSNFTLYFADGKTQSIAEGDLMQNHMLGAMACPCYDLPAGALAPVAGIWEGNHLVHAGATAPHPGRLCMALDASIPNLSESNICKNPMDFNPSAVYDGENNTCATLAQMCHRFRKDGGIVPLYLQFIHSFVPTCCNGKTEYNDDSGCGKSEAAPAPTDYCDGGEYDPDHILEIDCRSPVERDELGREVLWQCRQCDYLSFDDKIYQRWISSCSYTRFL